MRLIDAVFDKRNAKRSLLRSTIAVRELILPAVSIKNRQVSGQADQECFLHASFQEHLRPTQFHMTASGTDVSRPVSYETSCQTGAAWPRPQVATASLSAPCSPNSVL